MEDGPVILQTLLMLRICKNRKYFSFGAVIGVVFLCAVSLDVWRVEAEEEGSFAAGRKNISLVDGGLHFETIAQAETVGGFLTEQKIKLNDHDLVFPAQNEKIYSGSNIIIQRAKKISIKDGEKKLTAYTMQANVENAVWEQKEIDLGEDDFTQPARNTTIKEGMEIVVTHVLIKEETKEELIKFKTVTNEDDELSWRIKKVTQKGESGVNEAKYRVVYHNGKEISRKLLEKNKTKDPVDEVVTQGTLVKVGKVHEGAASWYAYTGTLAAANPWLPMGSYVRVTNRDNGKSVIVKINDRGPFGNGRIIDLDKVAFAQIASIGAGVVNVKMEVITN